MPVQNFLAELKRRKVFRVAVAYTVVGWVIIQFAATVFPMLEIPGWATRLVLMLVLLGFPVALLLTWALELTPEGVRLTHAVDQQSHRPVPAANWGWKRHALAYLAVAAVGGLGVFAGMRWWQPVLHANGSPPAAQASSDGRPAPIPGNKSIAVLPFVNMSDDPANEHFGDGLSEELLNLLAKEPGLRVAARTSSFSFKGKAATIAEVAKALNVDAVLEGSIRRSGNTMRVVAQLISASDGTHLWSEKYDREMSDIFAVQDDIADNILKALRPHLLAGSSAAASRASSGDISPALFERFLRGRGKFHSGGEANMKLAHEDFLAITREAPDYAPGHAWLALSWLGLRDRPDSEVLPAAQREVDLALKLDPNEAVAYLAQGGIHQVRDDDAKAMAALDRALEINPAMVEAHLDRQWLLASTGRGEEAVKELETARGIDPLHPDVLRDLAHLLNLQGKRREAFAGLDQLRAVNAESAIETELHLYSDNQEQARGAFIAGRYLEADPDNKVVLERLTSFNLTLGLNQEVAESRDDRRFVALAVLGRRAEAEAAAKKLLASTEDPVGRAVIEQNLLLARGDLDGAEKVLLDMWRSNASGAVGNEFGIPQAIDLVSLLMRKGGQPPAAEVAAALEKQVSGYSPLHQAGTQQFKFWIALFQGRKDDAVKILDALAAGGFQGRWQLGTPLPQMWVFEGEPRFAPALARIKANHAAQLAELERLRRSGMSLAQARAEYLASHGGARQAP